MERVAFGLLASLLACASAGAQQIIFNEPQSGVVFFGDVPSPAPGGQPPRDGRPAATGTGQIRGRVLAADSGQPVRKAMVRLSSTELRVSRTSSTDPDGRYEFRDLPAGRYTVTATKNTYVNISYGQRRPNQPGKPLQLADKQTLDRIDFTLPRGSVIAGRVLDEFGEPIADVQVVPMRNQFTPAGRRPMPSGRLASTNDIGEFRLYGLPPGQYYISATLRNQNFGPDGSDDRSGYAPTYYPGTPNIADAQALTVGTAETRSDIVLMLVATRTAQISGIVVDGQGQPVKLGSVQAFPDANGMGIGISGGPIRADGSFTVSGVAPGEYTLRAMVGRPSGDTPPEFATAPITVTGADISGVRLAPVKPVTLAGRIVVNASATAALRPEAFRFIAAPKASGPMMMGPPGRPEPVGADLSFQVKASPGDVVVRAAGVQQGWMVKEIRLNGRDVTDGLKLTAGQDVAGLEIEVTNRIPEISGVVTDSRDEPVHDYAAIIFPQDQRLWNTPSERRTGMVRADRDGRFTFRTLRPGNYYVAAVETIEPGQWMDPDYLAAIRTSAVSVSVLEGETKTVALKLLTIQ